MNDVWIALYDFRLAGRLFRDLDHETASRFISEYVFVCNNTLYQILDLNFGEPLDVSIIMLSCNDFFLDI